MPRHCGTFDVHRWLSINFTVDDFFFFFSVERSRRPRRNSYLDSSAFRARHEEWAVVYQLGVGVQPADNKLFN